MDLSCWMAGYLTRFLEQGTELTKSAREDLARVTSRLLQMQHGNQTLDLFGDKPFWTGPLARAEELSSADLAEAVVERLKACGITSVWKLRRAKWVPMRDSEAGDPSSFGLEASSCGQASQSPFLPEHRANGMGSLNLLVDRVRASGPIFLFLSITFLLFSFMISGIPFHMSGRYDCAGSGRI